MKILNINPDNTTSDACVAFEVDVTPDPKVLQMAQREKVNATFSDGLLFLETLSPDQRILSSDIDEFLVAYRKMEQNLARQDSEARVQHERLLQEISKRLDLPVGHSEED